MNLIEPLLFSTAAIAEILLLVAILHPANRRRVPVWLIILVSAAAIMHAAVFGRWLISDVHWPKIRHLDGALLLIICAGLLSFPSAMLHAAADVSLTSISRDPRRSFWHLGLYVPLLVLPWIARTIWQMDEPEVALVVAPYRWWYLVWLVIANASSIILFSRLKGRYGDAAYDAFLWQLSVCIGVATLIAWGYALMPADSVAEGILRLFAVLAPVIIALQFTWHLARNRLLSLMFERTTVYALAVLQLALIQSLVISPWIYDWQQATGIDFLLLEGIAVVALLMLVRPLRTRVTESLRYLFSTNLVQLRDKTRQLAVRLSEQATLDQEQLTVWFAEALSKAIDVDSVDVMVRHGSQWSDQRFASNETMATSPAKPDDVSRDYKIAIASGFRDGQRILEIGRTQCEKLEEAFEGCAALAAFRMDYRGINGAIIVGRRRRNDSLPREVMQMISLLVDQLAITIYQRNEESLRHRVERRMLQQEKLSLMGLMAGSIAHEIRNPLSSIRTITALVAEDLGESHACHRDLKMVMAETDRLALTTGRMLDFSRPSEDVPCRVSVNPVIQRIAALLDHFAKQHQVDLSLDLTSDDVLISATDASVSEIAFNLIKNAIEAASGGKEACVKVSSRREQDLLRIDIVDNGCGISPHLRETLFKPFATGKSDGNGLGLYAVKERVTELSGTITHEDIKPCGTKFSVRMPIAV